MDYLNNFNTVKEYNDYVNGGDCPYINVSNIFETKEVKYLDEEFEQTPFTIEVLSITQSASYIIFYLPVYNQNWKYFKYRVYQNSAWSEWVIDTPESTTFDQIQFVVGDKIQIITDGDGLDEIGMWPDGQWDGQQHDTDNQLKISGNYMSVFVGYRYKECPYPENENINSEGLWYDSSHPLCFSEWRAKETIVDASDLWLPKRCLGPNVYNNLMREFIYLTAAPNIDVTEVKDMEFYDAFNGCTSLTTAPNITIGKIKGSYVFTGMFSNCTNLVTGPNITILDKDVDTQYGGIFNEIFANCPNLTTITLPEINLAYDQAGPLSSGTSSINNITNYANHSWTIWSDINNAPQSGTLYYKDYGAEMAYNPADMVPSGWTCVALQENN